MTERQSNLSQECTNAVFDIVRQLGSAGLLDPDQVQRVLAADSETLAGAIDSFAAHARALGPLMASAVEISPEIEEGREEVANTPSRRLIAHLIGLESFSGEFWKSLGLRQGQAWDFGEEAIRDYESFRTYRKGCEEHIQAVRLYMRGLTDAEVMRELNAVSTAAIKNFRYRFAIKLHEFHQDGVHTLRRQFGAYLDTDQVEVLRAAFPESFDEARGPIAVPTTQNP
ncbi:MAG TPA: hypothetical protein VF733_01630 [Candidatus Saccharimonadales bacterium]